MTQQLQLQEIIRLAARISADCLFYYLIKLMAFAIPQPKKKNKETNTLNTVKEIDENIKIRN